MPIASRFQGITTAGLRSCLLLAVGLAVLALAAAACQRPAPTSLFPTSYSLLPTPYSLLPTPHSLLPALTDDEAVALIASALAERGVAPHAARIAIGGEPRWASVRYTSSYDTRGRAFQAQTILIALAVARVAIRVRPPLDGGVRLAVIPGEASEVGMRITTIGGESLAAWAHGMLSDQEFVRQWTVWTATKE